MSFRLLSIIDFRVKLSENGILMNQKAQSVIQALLFVLVALTSTLFLFEVPGYHYDEAWISEYAARIAFEPGFWPLFGMNQYTLPVMSYLQAGIFRLLGVASLESARVFYAGLNGIGFFLFYQWVRKMKPQAVWVFTLLWATLPLSVFLLRLNLEVTSGFIFFAALACFGITEGCFRQKKKLGFVCAVLALVLGSVMHVLFFSLILSGVWALAQIKPSLLEKGPLRSMMAFVIIPMIVFLLAPILHDSVGKGEQLKSALAIALGLLILLFSYSRSWSSRGIQSLLKFSQSVIYFLGIAGLLFFFIFELSGVWPISQSTGQIQILFCIPGFLIGGLFLFTVQAQKNPNPLSQFFQKFWIALSAFTVANVYKPTSARYWELVLLVSLLWFSLVWNEAARRRKWMSPLLLLCSALNLFFLIQDYGILTLHQGASSQSYSWLRIKDTSLYYRPIVPVYQFLQSERHLCREDKIYVDEGRNQSVLDIYRSLDQKRGRELPCSFSPRIFWVGQWEWVRAQAHQQGSELPPRDSEELKGIFHQKSWGDFWVFEPKRDEI